MLVYGDPQFDETLGTMLTRLRACLETLTIFDDIDGLRRLLIQAGQLEQAVQDHWPEPDAEARRLIVHTQKITELAAAAFYAVWAGANQQGTKARGESQRALASMAEQFEPLESVTNITVTVKVPEGFEFYGLYPEQYCASALRWLAERPSALPRRAMVVGIRSIGTSLSAVVAAALNAAEWRTHRLTMRPDGDAFRRTARINRQDLAGCECALIVDEGPGLSGSSMAAGAEALAGAGIPTERIAFFPGHDGEPGPAASGQVRQRWAATARYFTPLTQMRWNGVSLQECLLAKAAELCPSESPWKNIQDLGGGLWRSFIFPSEADWPAVATCYKLTKSR